MLRLRHVVMWVAGVAILMVMNGMIIEKALLMAGGQPVYLKLAPVDPRSLIQGDYMRLNYEIARELNQDDLPLRGKLVLQIDENRVAAFSRFYQPDEPLAGDEILLNYYLRNGDVWLAAESFFFQEGQADLYEAAQYAELRVTEAGESVLVGLRGEQLQPLGP